ncbi:twin transmembrane helix small protein [Endozoicomonas numazuensis]|uniref:Twin transmembrane helix small protein n=1 Tax=Endozoicomonas numazuensis TaxID=1137799 RepID=A0A081NDV9_9GAMM|nr:twin transmembrane helix small protein [Endozoicomonas numazuensis]KEQ16632.1 hypothetical protein GZ78_22675 [Endozoicomonas numazuensis]
MWLKIIIVLLFLAVLFCLGRGLYFLLKGEGSSSKLANSLTARVGLTALIMLIIVAAWLFGDIHSNAPWLYR